MIAQTVRHMWLAVFALLLGVPSSAQPTPSTPNPPGVSVSRMVLSSTAFSDGEIIAPRFTQAVAAPISPPLAWESPPEGTVTFALIMSDLDSAPKRSAYGVLHWMVFNIPRTSRGLPEDLKATQIFGDGIVQGANISGATGYRGPGAPAGGPYHHYSFELYALDIKLDLGPDASRAALLAAMDGHVLAKSALIGKFHK